MRKPDGLRAGETSSFNDALAGPLNWTVVCRVLNLDRKFLGTVEVRAGQVDINAKDPITRRTGPTLLDLDGLLDGPSMDRMLQFVYEVRVPELRSVVIPGEGGSTGATLPQVIPFVVGASGDGTPPTLVPVSPVVEVPVFTGPIIRPPARDGDVVTVECQDRAALAMRGVAGKTYPKGSNVVDLIERILREKCGETQFRFPRGVRDKTEDPVTVGREDELRPLVQCLQLAASVDLQLFWDGAGVCTLREYPEDPALDVSGLVISPGRIEPPSEVVNRVRVVGKRPKQHSFVAELPKGHPLSPESLAVGGVPQQFEVVETSDKFNTKAKARRRAVRLMNQYRRALEESRTYELAPIPHVDPFDRLMLEGDVVTVSEASLPLTASGAMTLGYTKPLR